ncbi:MAG: cell surface protein SprA [Bacteroidaceae bacterium]|nr:cell surface protein SprA [Bacteroidaceae bacterium]
MSISTIARNLDTAKGNSAFVVSSALSPEPPTPPADTVKVKRTDYPHGEHPDNYGMDLSDPENLKHDEGEYVEKTNMYRVGTKLGDSYLSAPTLMTPEEYLRWTERRSMDAYFKQRNDSLKTTKGKSKFDFSNMHFDLGPAEKIFGPGGVQVKTQGSAEVKMGYTYSFTDNPSLSERNRKTSAFDFDEKINLSLSASVGDKMNFNLNYNTEATFDFDTKNLKLAYEGKEDDIVKLLEAGNVTFPTNSSLIRGASSLFGFRTDLQFGKLFLQTVVSQKKSQSKSVSSQGGSQLSQFEIEAYNYDENRHFFLGNYFHDRYDTFCATLPNIMSGVTIKRIEVWMTNTSGTTTNTRNILGFVDLGEHTNLQDTYWEATGSVLPSNGANNLYTIMVNDSDNVRARAIDQASTVLSNLNVQGMKVELEGSTDYEKIENARLLNSSEYTLNAHLGYISLKSTLQPNQTLAVAYEYTYGGQTYQVGEFSADIKDNDKALFVKLLKPVNNSPALRSWPLMMKNVYSLNALSVQREKFKLDIKYLCDTTGVYMSYLPEGAYKDTTLLRVMNLDRLDNNNKTHPNGKFDYVEGYTVQPSTGRVIFPVAEPFGQWLRKKLEAKFGKDVADKYCYDELYDSTKTVAKQIAEKNKFLLTGEYKASSGSEIDLGSMNIPRGSVVVTAGGVTLTEGSDYSVDYTLGKVTIINQSIIDAGTNVNVSLESQSEYSTMRKTMLGLNWQYDFSKNFSIGGTLMRLTEKPLTSKVSMGEEPLNNTIWGLNVNWKQQSQWLTNMIDKIPLINVSAPSNISFSGDFAQLIAGQSKDTQGNASYIDDFENTKNNISVKSPQEWMISSTPHEFAEASLTNNIDYGKNRALLAWYEIDPLFTRRSSSLTPSHIKRDLDQLSNHYVRDIYVQEIYPNRETNYGESNTLDVLNLAFYPNERGPYNLDTDLDYDGHLNNPKKRWGGMMRKLDTSDFETSNVQYIEFWMMDPFIYTKDSANIADYCGDLYFNLGEVSEDVLKDGKKAYESGNPVNGNTSYTETVWGRVPNEKSVVYSFSNESGARQQQDVGLNGLSDTDERTFGAYAEYLNALNGKISESAYSAIWNDPAGDDYHYFRGSDFDAAEVSILDRYKRINMLEGNSPNTAESGETYSTAYKSGPDCEDVNMDYTMDEYEKYYSYHVSINPNDLYVGSKYIVDKREYNATLRNGSTENTKCNWYLFRIPVEEADSTIGSIRDMSSIRFMRVYMTNFQRPIVLRFASLDLVRGEWRPYKKELYTGDKPSNTGTMTIAAVNIEENNDKSPVNYVLPPGITRVVDPSQPQLTQENEQSLSITVNGLASGDARAVYKTMNLDLRRYKHLQMFVHANALEGEDDMLADKEMSVFIRVGSDYRSNYYEYEIPLNKTPRGHYDTYNAAGCEAVWPQENMLDIDLSIFTDVKHERNKARAHGAASYTSLYRQYDPNRPNNRISIMGNPTLGEVKTMMIGVRNNSRSTKNVEIWVNELRLQDYANEGGWAAQGNLSVQLSDLGSVNLTGHVETAGFGGIEEKVNERRDDNLYEWSITTQFELGKLFPEKWKMQLPFYYSYSWQKISPKYNPFDTDMLLKDAIDECENQNEKDSLRSMTETVVKNKNISLSNWKSGYQSRKPMPWDPANFTISYSHSQKYKTGETTVYENEENWKGSLTYSYAPKYKPLEPFKDLKGKSKWLDIIKAQNLQWLPQSIQFNTDLSRQYYEYQERDLDANSKLPVTWSDQMLWNRSLSLRWDLFKSLKMSWTSNTHAEIEEPYRVVNKNLYPDDYTAWKDSVKRSLLSFGRPLTYNSTFNASYAVPLNKIPILDWVTADGSYNSSYGWKRGTELEDGRSLGHVATTQRTVNLNGRLNLETLYKKWKFLEETEKRFSGNNKKEDKTKTTNKIQKPAQGRNLKSLKDAAAAKDGEPLDGKEGKKQKGFSKEVQLSDTVETEVKHALNSKRLIVRATTVDGQTYQLKYKRTDANTIKILNSDTIPIKVNIVAKKPLEENGWYKAAQILARALMSVRNVSISYRNTYSLSLPGFKTEIGDAFGQKKTAGGLSPGLGFAFGMIGDSFVQKAADRGWLMTNDSTITTPASMSNMSDLQVKVTLEPLRDVKIDVNASRTENRAKSVQFMYAGMPTTLSGSFNQTIISLKTAFSKMGNIDNNYASKPFENFISYLPIIQHRVESRYADAVYPDNAGSLAGQTFNPANGTVNMYSADVMVPAFLAAYCGGNATSSPLDIFPSLWRMLPNWSLKYSGLVKLPWFSQHFKSFNLNHAYKSVYTVGAYNSYASWMEYMGDLGFVSDVTTGSPVPSSIYNISTVSINESFSPLLGIDMTFNSGMTAKVEYKKTRTLNLSMTSVALTENYSDDLVFGVGYKIKDISLFGAKRIQDPASAKQKKNSKNKKGQSDNQNAGNNNSSAKSTGSKKVGGVSHDLNLRIDFSYRMQSAINRNIQTAMSTATSGNTAYKLAINADYTFSRLLTMSAFFDWQKTKPLVSQSSYPTTTADFGINIKFSLTR